MTDFLLELRSEEIPARMQAKARDDLARLFTAELDKAGLKPGAITTYATPRRLALIARDLPDATDAVSEEIKGPRVGAPPQALEGFLRKTCLTQDQLVERDGVLFAIKEVPGQSTAAVLAEAVWAICHGFPWPKSMRWGEQSKATTSLRWVRPLSSIVALFGDEIVPGINIDGIAASRETVGHRFMSSGAIAIESAATYADQLRAAHVIVDQDERAAIIRTRAAELAAEVGLELIEDEGLVAENAGLTEWPVPLLGRFDEAFLSVPPEVIQLTARVNQKYFVCNSSPARGGGPSAPADGGGGAVPSATPGGSPPPSGAGAPATSPSRGGLANAFICVANIAAADGGAKIVEGNRKVLAARLSDARFFYETDLKVPLDEQAKKLANIVFHEKLGTVADKVDRVAKLARWLVEEGIVPPNTSPERGGGPFAQANGGGVSAPPPTSRPQSANSPASNPSTTGSAGGPPPRSGEVLELAALAERAAKLCKADLVTGMVGEFPELQGVMGGYYAAAQGEDPQVAAAIRDHYKPVGQGDDVPTDPVTVAVSLADKLDTTLSFLSIDLGPTGSKDPFAIRRAILACASLIIANDLRVGLNDLIWRWVSIAFDVMKGDFDQSSAANDYVTRFNEQLLLLMQHTDRDEFSTIREEIVPHIKKLIIQPEALRFEFWSQLLQRGAPNQFSDLRNVAITATTDRLKVQQREAGVRHDLIDAVFALGGEDDLVRLLARVHALQSFITTEDGTNLLAGYKRAANILKKEDYDGFRATLTEAELARAPEAYPLEPAEAALIEALDAAEPRAGAAIGAEDFAAAMTALATLRAPIDAFFADVTVNDPIPPKRAARLALLARFRDLVHQVADFSKIEG